MALVSRIAMEPKPALPESVSLPAKDRRRSKLRIGMAVVGVLLLALLLWLVFTSLSGNQVVWLTPAELARRTQPGPFSAIKRKIWILAGPLRGLYRRNRPQIVIETSLGTPSLTTIEESGLGAPVTTNTQGLRAWVLTPAESSAFRIRLKAAPGASTGTIQRAQTFDGGQMQLQSVDFRIVSGKLTPVGLNTELTPKIVSRSVKLTMAVTFTELVQPPADKVSTVRTNFRATCQAVIPSGGSLVLDGGPPKNGGENRYLLIVSPKVWNVVDKQSK